MVAPALRKGGQSNRAAQKRLLSPGEVYRRTMSATLTPCCSPAHQANRVARSNDPFAQDSEVETRAAALLEPLHHVEPPEPDPELEARKPGLRDDELRGADVQAVADVHGVLAEALGREVLAEGAPRQRDVGQLRAPVGVVLGRIDVDGLVWTSVNREIGLLIAVQVQGAAQTGPATGSLKIDVRTRLPRDSTSRGRPTLIDRILTIGPRHIVAHPAAHANAPGAAERSIPCPQADVSSC